MKTAFQNEFAPVRKLITVATKTGIVPVFSCCDSGIVVTRQKVDNPHNSLHPAVIIGRDAYCRLWVAHNHFSNKRPSFDLLEDYLNGQTCYLDNRCVDFDNDVLVDRAIFEVMCGDLYHSTDYNGHTFVNNIVWRDVVVQPDSDAKTAAEVLVKFLLHF
ncbi:MAG: hypothetical protein M3R17_10035 [Bacteroidota bacterium]|nr:hypothetical protein [Bacteroidota bacterium]